MTMTRNNVHEPDESDVRHVAGRHLQAARDQVDARITAYAEPFYIRT
jgi:hypothetical protein